MIASKFAEVRARGLALTLRLALWFMMGLMLGVLGLGTLTWPGMKFS